MSRHRRALLVGVIGLFVVGVGAWAQDRQPQRGEERTLPHGRCVGIAYGDSHLFRSFEDGTVEVRVMEGNILDGKWKWISALEKYR